MVKKTLSIFLLSIKTLKNDEVNIGIHGTIHYLKLAKFLFNCYYC